MNHRFIRALTQFFRYAGIGGFAFLIDLAVLSVAVDTFSCKIITGATAGFITGAIVNYLLCIRFVFSSRALKQPRWAEFGIFVAIGIVGLGINDLILFVWHTHISELNYKWAKLVAGIVVLVFNFSSRKIILFRDITQANDLPSVPNVTGLPARP